jgi:hypothetical protein
MLLLGIALPLLALQFLNRWFTITTRPVTLAETRTGIKLVIGATWRVMYVDAHSFV